MKFKNIMKESTLKKFTSCMTINRKSLQQANPQRSEKR